MAISPGPSWCSRDITERRRSEETVAESETQLRTILATVPNGILSLGQDGRIQSVNAELTRIFGYSQGELIGQPIELLVPKGRHGRHVKDVAGYMASGRDKKKMASGREVSGIRKDGSSVPLEVGLNRSKLPGGGVQVVATVQDISERKRTEAEREKLVAQIAESEARLRTILATAPKRHSLHWPRWADSIGQRRAHADFRLCGRRADRRAHRASGAPETSTAQHVKDVSGYMASGRDKKMASGREVSGIRKDGSSVPLEVGLSRSETPGGGLQVVATVQDISERKRTEAERERLVARLTETNEELERFAYVASHDLKAPLRGIDNLATWIEEDLADVMSDETKENMDLLRNRVFRLEKLLDDLLRYSRRGAYGGAGRKTRRRRNWRAGAFELANHGEFELEVEGDPAELVTASAPLEQILRNLIQNAIKHHDRDRGRLKLVIADRTDALEFRLSDDGPGIAKKYQERIFGLFQTLQSRDRVEGSGMGLAIIKKILKNLDRDIRVDSDPEAERGSTFTFTWPKDWPRETREAA